MTDGDDDNNQTGLNYELLVEDALRSVVKSSLRIVENVGLPGKTHFYISFNTSYDGVKIDGELRAKYPEQMTLVIQHQYADLRVADDHFGITLFFGGKPSPMIIPFQSITSFNDPSIGFGLQFGMLDENDEDGDNTSSEESSPRINLKSGVAVDETEDARSDSTIPNDEKTADIVSLDTFRKRPTN